MEPIKSFYLIRHVGTDLNCDKDKNKDRIRGWLDIPIASDGYAQIACLISNNAEALRTVEQIYTSDLQRAFQTANAIASIFGAKLIKFPALRPWNVGVYSGQLTCEALTPLNDYCRNRPDEKVPDGESFNEFKNRVFKGLRDIVKKVGPNLEFAIVTHYRVERLVESWIAAGCPADYSLDTSTWTQRGEPVGHMERMSILSNRLTEIKESPVKALPKRLEAAG